MVTQAGQYWLTLVDQYGASGMVLLIIVFCEVVGFSLGFGTERIALIVQDMLGHRPSRYMLLCWRFFSPAICIFLFFLIVIRFEPLTYADGTPYPFWSQFLGILMIVIGVITIPTHAIYAVYKAPGKTIREKFQNAMMPRISRNLSNQCSTMLQGIADQKRSLRIRRHPEAES